MRIHLYITLLLYKFISHDWGTFNVVFKDIFPISKALFITRQYKRFCISAFVVTWSMRDACSSFVSPRREWCSSVISVTAWASFSSSSPRAASPADLVDFSSSDKLLFSALKWKQCFIFYHSMCWSNFRKHPLRNILCLSKDDSLTCRESDTWN